MSWFSWHGLLLVVATNTAPVIAARLLRGHAEWPIDRGLVLSDHQRLLGAHKTWRGLAAGVLLGAAAAPAIGVSWAWGALAGLTAIAGDASSSFVKRRLALRPGACIPGLDQLPESMLPLLALWSPLGLDARSFVGTAAVFCVLALGASRLYEWIGSREQRPPGLAQRGARRI